MTTLRRCWLRWLYGFHMVNAYLAQMMGERDVSDNLQSVAKEFERELAVLSIQP